MSLCFLFFSLLFVFRRLNKPTSVRFEVESSVSSTKALKQRRYHFNISICFQNKSGGGIFREKYYKFLRS